MKITVNINLNGDAFIINEDAYAILKEYIDAKGEFVEGRLATTLSSSLRRSGRKIVEVDDVNAAIERIEHPATETFEAETNKFRGRKLYRDTVNGVAGGVSSGLAAYIGWDETIIRLLWVLLFFVGSGVVAIAYILLWMFVPEAKTAAQRVAMYGKELTEKNLEEEATMLREGNTGGGCLGMLFKIFIILSALCVVFPIFLALFFVLFISGVVGIGVAAPVIGGWEAIALIIAIVMMLLCPIATLIYLGINLKSNSNPENENNKKKGNSLWVYLILLLVWIASVVFFFTQSKELKTCVEMVKESIESVEESMDEVFDDDFDEEGYMIDRTLDAAAPSFIEDVDDTVNVDK